MASTYTVLLSELVSEFKLDFFYRSTDFDKIHVTVDDISRPGLHLAGFFDHYEPMRVYVCGDRAEAAEKRLKRENIPCQSCRNYDKLIESLRDEDSFIFILPTYTAMLELRAKLVRRLGGKNFWE